MSNNNEWIDARKEGGISLVKIKEGNMMFVAAIFKFADEWLDENYPDEEMKGYVQNSPDGCYEVFALPPQPLKQ